MNNRKQPTEFTKNVKQGKNGNETLNIVKTPNVNLVKKPVGPVAEVKETPIKEQNIQARMHNVMEIKDRATSTSKRRFKPLKMQRAEPIEKKKD